MEKEIYKKSELGSGDYHQHCSRYDTNMIFREAQKKIPLFFPFLLPFAVVKYSAIDNSAECGTIKCTWRQLVTNSNQHGGSVKKIIGSVDHEVRGESIWVKRPSA